MPHSMGTKGTTREVPALSFPVSRNPSVFVFKPIHQYIVAHSKRDPEPAQRYKLIVCHVRSRKHPECWQRDFL